MNSARILVVDDTVAIHKIISEFLEMISDKCIVELISALNLEDAKKLYIEYQGEFDMIAVDACISSYIKPDSVPFINWLRDSGYESPIVAISSLPEFNRALVTAGCSSECIKMNFPYRLSKIFG